MIERLLTMAALASSIPCCRGFAASVEPNRIPIQAELVKGMEAGRVKAGDTVFAKVDIAWKDSTCNLRKGAVLKGRVVSESARSKIKDV